MSAKSVLILIFVIVLSVTSCQKRRLNRDTTTSIDMSIAEGGFNDIQKVSEDALKEAFLEGKISGGFKDIYGSPMVTVTPAWPDSSFPKDILIDFGTGTTDLLGHNRSGVLSIHATGMYKDSGAVFIINPSNYYVNDYSVEGKKTILNTGRNSNGNINYAVVVADGSVTLPSSDVIFWESNRNREWVGGAETDYVTDGLAGIVDDSFSITGKGSGVNRLGRAYSVSIINPLIFGFSCRYMQKGELEIAPNELDVRTIDYGSGTCDNDATVTVDNRTYNIKLW